MSIKSRVRSLKEKRPPLDDEPSTATQLVDRRDEDKTAVAPTTRNSLITLSPSSSFARRAMMGTANLAKLLPSGTLLAFQLLTPIFTRNGSCDPTTQTLTLGLLLILAASCFLGCLTDSLRASDGQVYYGLATFKGMWLFDYPAASASGIPGNLSEYRLRLIDAVHAVLSVLVFGVVALKDRNVVSCFYPSPKHETKEILDIVPVGIGLICSLLFMAFPTTRHGFGYPIASTD
ncbi:hypothetical protein Nepgr_008602 [Nepenthes gracilis]|uniref:Uncharacterized protein n=1 Tax=Nepenthes gracilis TaxID=150966 RepID=A0AAD3XJE0_NEPGR|nr:hypothetical protein Nepgr_008602 [Nepenthes gracilis]